MRPKRETKHWQTNQRPLRLSSPYFPHSSCCLESPRHALGSAARLLAPQLIDRSLSGYAYDARFFQGCSTGFSVPSLKLPFPSGWLPARGTVREGGWFRVRRSIANRPRRGSMTRRRARAGKGGRGILGHLALREVYPGVGKTRQAMASSEGIRDGNDGGSLAIL